MSSVLHECIGDILKRMEKPLKIDVILDPACAGSKYSKQRIPLFIKKPKSNKTELCNVDAMIIQNGKIKIIIEIEESDNKPTQICGKYLTTNLAKFYNYGSLSIDIDNASVFFIQIVDIKNISKSSSKPDKFINIETAIKNLILTARTNKFDHGCIKGYKIIKFDAKKNMIYTKSFNEDKELDKTLTSMPEELAELLKSIKNGIK
jgi:hypothetical protein